MEALSVEERLKRLEKENKRLRKLIQTIVPQPGRIVEAERFVLRDASGKTRAELGLVEDEPSLQLYDASGKVRAVLRLIAGWPALWLIDASGKPRVALGVDADELRRQLAGASGKPLAALVVTGAAGIQLFDEAGNVTWRAP
jgi:hypothetical protein